MDSCFALWYTRRNYIWIQMANKKNKKKRLIPPLNFKGLPGYDFYFMLLIVLFMVVLATCGCYSPDTVYVREYHHPRPFGTSLYIHHDYHHSHHHDHYRHSNRRSSSPSRKVVTPTRTPPPSRPISKGVPEPPSNPRDRR